MSVDMARPHIVALQKRITPSERAARRKSRSINRFRNESPASSIGTFFDDESSSLPDASAYEASLSSRADSAMSSRSDERSKMDERSDKGRLNSISETQPENSQLSSATWSDRTPSRLHMWPDALRIAKSPSPTDDSRPATAIGLRHPDSLLDSTPPRLAQRSMSIEPPTTRVEPRPMHRRFNSIQQDETINRSHSFSRPGPRPQVQHSTSISHDLTSSQNTSAQPSWRVSEFAKPWVPGSVNSLAAMGSAPREVRPTGRRPSVSPTSPVTTFVHKSSSSIDWTAVSPRHRPSITKMPTPPESPTPSLCDDSSSPDPSIEAADIVIGRRLTMKTSFTEDAVSPTCPTFIRDGTFSQTKLSMNPSGFIRTHTPSASLDSITEANELAIGATPLPLYPLKGLQSPSKNNLEELSEDLVSPRTVINRSRNDSTSTRSMRSARSDRSDRSAAISEAIRELGTRWDSHFERYTKLRQSRQMLHSEILSDLQNNQPKPKGAKTPLQMQLEMASMDAAIDDCVSKLAQVDKKRQRLVDELMMQVQPQSQTPTPITSPVRRGHARNESMGIQEIIPMPHSPPMPSGMASLAAQISGARLQPQDRWFEKQLPRVPSKELRLSSESLSLANVMEFLDTSEPEMGLA
ncbi:hypothetical protein K461DRAFT_122262 [Myriangium duriaei CBS 260.36]|uniref:Up-regulated during septation protein 1 domain-containing protein n=1 Tax=Myriangium duriaei CBS 260.36 TaxID=1168546 RepID=A0A9P4J270_9PEZI|nr:hypothetical protein K461DRAFT_122262 [Myriangium duriaei CBS 260.36]